MKILHLSTENTWRGGENQLRYLLTGSQECSLEHHLVLQPKSSIQRYFKNLATIHEVSIKNEWDIVAALKLLMLVRRLAIEIIHAHTARGHTIGLFVKYLCILTKMNPPKLIVHRRVEQKEELGFFSRWKYLNTRIDQYIAVSHAIGKGLERCGVEKSKISVIHSGVEAPIQSLLELQKKRQATRSEFNLRDNDFLFIFVGAIETLKGINVLMTAWDKFCQTPHSDQRRFYLMVTGEGSLKSKIIDLKLPNVIVTGFRNDVNNLLCASDVLLLPTLWEGLGTILLDGAFANTTLVASNVGGVPEIVVDCETGLLVDANSSTSLFNAMNRLVNDDQLCHTLRIHARSHVARHFTVQGMIERVIQLYNK